MAKRIGRPPRISRESILDAGIATASTDPFGLISIGAIARHLKVTPMAIYTYFANKDELMQALSQRLLEGLKFDVADGTTPHERVKAWAYGIYEHFLENPALIRMLSWEGGHNSVAWLNKSAILIVALDEMGLPEDDRTQSILWIWQSVLGAVQFEIYDRQTNPRLNETEFSELSPAVRDGIGRVDCFLRNDAPYKQFFEFQMARLLDGLHGLQH